MTTQAQLALDHFKSRKSKSIPAAVKFFGGHGPDKDWDTRFYHFPDGSWIATRGAGKAHQSWTGPADAEKEEVGLK